MKKLFKNMSIVLVLALIVGLVPARTAAAAEYTLARTAKTLFVGARANGRDANGNLPAAPCKKSYKVKVNGVTPDDVISFKSSDKTVAKGVKRSGRIWAKGVGTADVAVKVNGEEIGTIAITAKQNATAVAAKLPENKQFGIGKTLVEVEFTPATADDLYRVKIADTYKDIATVDEDGMTVITKKPGEFKLTVETFQSAALPGPMVESEEYTCTAAVGVVSTAQKSASEIKYVFDTDMTGMVKAADFKLTYELNGAKYDVAIKSAQVVKAAPTNVIVEAWTPFTAEREYNIDYNKQSSFKFTAAKLTADKVASIRFDETEYVYGQNTKILYTVLDANGVEFAADDVKANMTFVTASSDCSISGDEIVFFQKDKKADVKAKYSAWIQNATTKQYEEYTKEGTATLTSVEAKAPTVKDSKWSLGLESVADFDAVDYKQRTSTALNRETTFDFAIEYSDDSTIDSTADIAKLTFTSADNNVLVMNGRTVKPVKEGTTQIIVNHKDYKDPIFVIPVTITAKAVPTVIEVKPAKTNLNVATAAGFTDAIEVAIAVKDQYGDYCPAKVVAEQCAGSKDVEFKKNEKDFALGAGSFEVKIDAASIYGVLDFDGKYVGISVYATDGVVKTSPKNFTVSMKKSYAYGTYEAAMAATGVSARIEKLEGHDPLTKAVDTTAVKDHALDFADIKVAAYDEDGYCISPAVGAKHYSKLTKITEVAATATAFAYKLYKGSKELTNDDYAKLFATDGQIGSYTVNASGAATKLAVGDYTVQLYKFVDAKNSKGVYERSSSYVVAKNFTVIDDQPGLTVKKVKDFFNDAAVKDAFEVYYGDSTVALAAGVDFDTVEGTDYKFVKKASIKIDITGGEYFVVSAPVNVTLSKKVK